MTNESIFWITLTGKKLRSKLIANIQGKKNLLLTSGKLTGIQTCDKDIWFSWNKVMLVYKTPTWGLHLSTLTKSQLRTYSKSISNKSKKLKLSKSILWKSKWVARNGVSSILLCLQTLSGINLVKECHLTASLTGSLFSYSSWWPSCYLLQSTSHSFLISFWRASSGKIPSILVSLSQVRLLSS
jgi:hypothetical protein